MARTDSIFRALDQLVESARKRREEEVVRARERQNFVAKASEVAEHSWGPLRFTAKSGQVLEVNQAGDFTFEGQCLPYVNARDEVVNPKGDLAKVIDALLEEDTTIEFIT